MSELVLKARLEGQNERHARIGVFQNGGKAGVLCVEAEHAQAVLDAINSAIPRMKTLDEYIRRMERYANTQVSESCNSPTWIGYHQALKDCLQLLPDLDVARKE